MKPVARCFLLLLMLLSIGFTMSAFGDEPMDDKTQLETLLDEFLAGASRNDAAVHDRFWSESLVYTSSDGSRFGKAAIMAGLRQQAAAPAAAESPPSARYWAEAVKVRVLGETAVVTFRLKAEVPGGGSEAPERRDFFNTGTFLREAGAWRAIAWQATVTEVEP